MNSVSSSSTDGQMKEDKAKIFVGPSLRTDPSSIRLTTAQHTVAP